MLPGPDGEIITLSLTKIQKYSNSNTGNINTKNYNNNNKSKMHNVNMY